MLGLGLGLTLVLSGCSAPGSPDAARPRTQPDAVERAAVAVAQSGARDSGLTTSDALWTQLWTPTQAGARIASCVGLRSGGAVRFAAFPMVAGDRRLDFSVHLADGTPAESPFVEDPGLITQLVDGCFAVYSVDDRLGSVPARDRNTLYSYDLTTLRRCLVAHGQEVPRLPDRATFERLLRSGVPWNAYDLVVVSDRGAWYALSDACPAFPPKNSRG